MTLLNQCKRLLLARGATLDGSAPQALRGVLNGMDLLLLCPGKGMPLSWEEKQAVHEIRRKGGLAFVVVDGIEQLQAELEGTEA